MLSELRGILDGLNNDCDEPVWDSSDPDVTRFLIGLINDPSEKFANPFQMSESVRRELVARAEESGARALSWNQSDFDKVGGKGMIRRVWNSLKSDGQVCGTKRSISVDSDEGDEHKKFKLSLNLSGTCDLIDNIELMGGGDVSLSVSVDSRSMDRVDPNESISSNNDRVADDLLHGIMNGMNQNVAHYLEDAVVE